MPWAESAGQGLVYRKSLLCVNQSQACFIYVCFIHQCVWINLKYILFISVRESISDVFCSVCESVSSVFYQS